MKSVDFFLGRYSLVQFPSVGSSGAAVITVSDPPSEPVHESRAVKREHAVTASSQFVSVVQLNALWTPRPS